MASNQGKMISSPEPLDCSSPILDLCIRKRSRSRSPSPPTSQLETNNNTSPVHSSIHPELASSTSCGISSSSPDSENSVMSASPNPYYDHYPQSIVPTTTSNRLKAPRPFKAYPKDPLSLASGVNTAVFGENSVQAYVQFRHSLLARVQATNGITNKNMRRMSQTTNNNRHDPNYWEKRRKNNEAAKRSRDARRAKEDEIAIRAAFLEQENFQLRCELATTQKELNLLREKLPVYGPKITNPYAGFEYNH
ncbi:hypothetical protein ILUMI_01624 [Ignelater luminosus]|uniref:BZIP domain-containing protein n=1 Tax=Ignelater luminosus TaxID=2038154 RepID=A0A8K0DJN0_IGNLU|nr:hypothetical protein ILUMI_01624 [Ignelater luminosus]